MIIRNELNDVVKFKIVTNDYTSLQPMQEYNVSLSNSVQVLELVNPSFASRRKTLITISMFPILLTVYIVCSIFGALSFEYSYYYDLNNNYVDDICIFKYDKSHNIVLENSNTIIENCGHSRKKSFILFILLSFYSILVYIFITLIIYVIFN